MSKPPFHVREAPGLAMTAQTVPIEWVSPGLPALRGHMANREGLLLLDTAAGIELIERRIASRGAVHSLGTLHGKRLDGSGLSLDLVEVEDLVVGPRKMGPLTAGLIEMDRFLPKETLMSPVIGAVAASFFKHHPATFALGENKVMFESSATLACRRHHDGIPLQIQDRGGHGLDLFAEMTVDSGKRGWFEIDTCCTAVMLHPRMLPPGSAGLGEARCQLAFTQRPENATDSRVLVREMVYDGVLGLPFLKRIRFTLDLSSERVWLLS